MSYIPRKIGSIEMITPPAYPDLRVTYICDASDIANLPDNVGAGSCALCLDTKDLYVYHDGTWELYGGLDPSGTLTITENGTYDVTYKRSAIADIPMPEGSMSITENGTYDVSAKASAVVDVPTGITPTGSMSITENGTYDVTAKASAVVDVPAGITPTGSMTITENGTYDVTAKASAVVNVPQGGSVVPAGYTEIVTASTRNYASTVDNYVPGFTNAKVQLDVNDDIPSTGDQVYIKGSYSETLGGASIGEFAVWGTVTNVHRYTPSSGAYYSVTLTVAGVTVSPTAAAVQELGGTGLVNVVGHTGVFVAPPQVVIETSMGSAGIASLTEGGTTTLFGCADFITTNTMLVVSVITNEETAEAAAVISSNSFYVSGDDLVVTIDNLFSRQ